MEEKAIITQQQIVKPAVSTQDMERAISAYKSLQETLDRALPDCIQSIAGKHFRKKNYWRAVKVAFNLRVECIKEEKIDLNNDDWGYVVTYRAIAPNGASADGDGSCTYKEKATGQVRPTLHNIRSQAHTRAFNRAVSNLVGFGEVSAEEVIGEQETQKENIKAVKITNVQQKKGKTKKGKEWILYIITDSDKIKYHTFSRTLAGQAKEAKEKESIVEIEYETTEKGNNLKTIHFLEEESVVSEEDNVYILNGEPDENNKG